MGTSSGLCCCVTACRCRTRHLGLYGRGCRCRHQGPSIGAVFGLHASGGITGPRYLKRVHDAVPGTAAGPVGVYDLCRKGVAESNCGLVWYLEPGYFCWGREESGFKTFVDAVTCDFSYLRTFLEWTFWLWYQIRTA